MEVGHTGGHLPMGKSFAGSCAERHAGSEFFFFAGASLSSEVTGDGKAKPKKFGGFRKAKPSASHGFAARRMCRCQSDGGTAGSCDCFARAGRRQHLGALAASSGNVAWNTEAGTVISIVNHVLHRRSQSAKQNLNP